MTNELTAADLARSAVMGMAEVYTDAIEALIADRDARCTEVERLRRWKEEARTVLTDWVKVHDALGSPGALGESMALSSLAEVGRLTRHNADLVDDLVRANSFIAGPTDNQNSPSTIDYVKAADPTRVSISGSAAPARDKE